MLELLRSVQCERNQLPSERLDSHAEEQRKGCVACFLFFFLSIVACFCCFLPPLLPQHDDEGRTITAEYETHYLVLTYVPNAGQKLERLAYRTTQWGTFFARSRIKFAQARLWERAGTQIESGSLLFFFAFLLGC